MTVNELRKLIADLPGDMLVVTNSGDHSYILAYPSVAKAVKEGRQLSEWYEGEPGTPIDVLSVGAG